MTGSIIRLGLNIPVNDVKEARYALNICQLLFQTGVEKKAFISSNKCEH